MAYICNEEPKLPIYFSPLRFTCFPEHYVFTWENFVCLYSYSSYTGSSICNSKRTLCKFRHFYFT